MSTSEEIVASAIRRGRPHDGSDLDLAVDEDARQIVTALRSAGLLAPAAEPEINEQPAPEKRRAFFSATRTDSIWRCEKEHLDDFHLSIEGVPERCSRCGGEVREYIPVEAASRAAVPEPDWDAITRAAVPVLVEVFGCDEATAWNALYPPNGALGAVPAAAVPEIDADELEAAKQDPTVREFAHAADEAYRASGLAAAVPEEKPHLEAPEEKPDDYSDWFENCPNCELHEPWVCASCGARPPGGWAW